MDWDVRKMSGVCRQKGGVRNGGREKKCSSRLQILCIFLQYKPEGCKICNNKAMDTHIFQDLSWQNK